MNNYYKDEDYEPSLSDYLSDDDSNLSFSDNSDTYYDLSDDENNLSFSDNSDTYYDLSDDDNNLSFSDNSDTYYDLSKNNRKRKICNRIERTKKRRKINPKGQNYNTIERDGDSVKKSINQAFAKNVRERISLNTNSPPYTALILDSSSLNTTKYLKKLGFVSENILIPQCDQNDFNKMKGNHSSLYEGKLSEVINIVKKGKFDAIWCDYCGSYRGNKTKKIHPYQDVNQIFNKRLLKDYSVLAVTCSLRCPPKNKMDYINHITKCANLNGYYLIKKYFIDRYNRQMSVVIFDVFSYI